MSDLANALDFAFLHTRHVSGDGAGERDPTPGDSAA
jgi:hypothetical protein